MSDLKENRAAEIHLAQAQPKFLTDLFRASAQAHRNRPALWVDGSTISYAELDDVAMQLAASIIASRSSARNGQCGLMVDRTLTAYAAGG